MIVKNCNTICIHYFLCICMCCCPICFQATIVLLLQSDLSTHHTSSCFLFSSFCLLVLSFPQNPDIVLVHYLNVPAIEDCGKPCGPILCSINTDKKEWAKWTKEELIGQLKPMCECPITSNHWMHNLSLLKHVLSDHCKQCLKKYHYQTVWGWYNLT